MIWPFSGPKSRFFDFLKVVLEMFRSCLGIVFGFKRPTFRHCFRLKTPTFIKKKMLPNNPSPLGSRVSPKSERGARGCVGGVGGVGVGVLPFYTLDHFGTIFFQVFSVVRCLA